MDTNNTLSQCNYIVSNSFETWHFRLGHASNSYIHTLAKSFPLISCNTNNMKPCDSWHFAKHKKFTFPTSITHTHAPFDILHADLWGPFATESIHGHKYFLTIVYDFSRFTCVIFLKTKTENKQSIIHFIGSLENQFNTTFKCLKFDNGTKFLALSSSLLSKGISH